MTTRPSALQIWIAAARPKTLPAAVAPVLLGSALAWRDGTFIAPAALSCLAFALLIQIGTNFANDYYDFVQGADTAERVGPKRAVAAGWVSPATMKRAMIAVFAVAFAAGLSLLQYGGWPLLVVGVASILCGIAYTGGPYPLGYHGLGDLFVFIFFGLVAVCTTYFVQAGSISAASVLVATGVGLLAANILVVNNYRDVETDAKAGKRTLVVRWGRRYARWQFGLSHVIAGLVVPGVLVGLGEGSAIGVSLVSGFCMVVAWRQTVDLERATTAAELIALLGRTGKYVALYALLLSVWIVVG
ncbi:MAG TPA: 1,4-dihydroxy-2-naphthoate polyprenyltransferase [Opitutaceae bacterium]